MTSLGHARGLPAGAPAPPDELERVPVSGSRPRTAAWSDAPAAAIADPAARLRQMVEEHFELVWRTLRGLGVPAASADDAAQQVFWIASRKLDAIAPGSERAFLFAIARGTAANARRARHRNPETPDEDALAVQVDSGPDPEQAASASEARRVLEGMLDRMTDDLRAVFVLFELEGMTMAEIAEILELPAGTVASRLRRAREAFDREAALVRDGRAAP